MSVSGLDASQIQGVPVSTTPPTNNQGLLYNAATGQWTPTNLNAALEAGPGIAIGLDAVTGAAIIGSTVNGFLGVNFLEINSGVSISDSSQTPILSVGPFNVGQVLTITTWITVTNTGSAGLFSPTIQIGNSGAPVSAIASSSVLVPASAWGNISLSAAYTVSSPNNYIWVTGIGQAGATMVAQPANAASINGATGIIVPIFA